MKDSLPRLLHARPRKTKAMSVLLLTAHPYLLLEYLALHRGEVVTLRMEGLLNVLCVFGFGRGAGRSRRGTDRLGHPANSSPA